MRQTLILFFAIILVGKSQAQTTYGISKPSISIIFYDSTVNRVVPKTVFIKSGFHVSKDSIWLILSDTTSLSNRIGEKADTVTTITTGSGLTGGGSLRTDRTISADSTTWLATDYDVSLKANKSITLSAGTAISPTGLGDLSANKTINADTAFYASATQSGFLKFSDWTTFNSKESALTKGDLTANAPASISATRQVIGGAAAISIDTSTTGTGLTTLYQNSLKADKITTITVAANAPLSSSAGAQDLSTNRTWTLSADTSTAGSGLTTLFQNSLKANKSVTFSAGIAISSTGLGDLSANRTINADTTFYATATSSGFLKFSDWTIFNNKESALTFTTPLLRTANTVSLRFKRSVTSDNDSLMLVGDLELPGNSKYYGTDGGGTKGFFDLPAGSDTTSLSNRIDQKEPTITASNTIKQYWNGFKQFVGLNTDSLIEGSTNKFYVKDSSFIRINVDTIRGKSGNTATVDDSLRVTGRVTGGKGNFGKSNLNSGLHAFVAGIANNASGNYSSVTGGESNTASGFKSHVSGGTTNTASGNFSSVTGGLENIASAIYSTVPGGYQNVASGNYSIASGRRAIAQDQGSFVWADSKDEDFNSIDVDEFALRAGNGVRIVGANPRLILTSSDKNTNVSTEAQASDTSVIYGSWTGTRKPEFRMRSNDGTLNWYIDSTGTLRNGTIPFARLSAPHFFWTKSFIDSVFTTDTLDVMRVEPGVTIDTLYFDGGPGSISLTVRIEQVNKLHAPTSITLIDTTTVTSVDLKQSGAQINQTSLTAGTYLRLFFTAIGTRPKNFSLTMVGHYTP